jgi:hypothetical protein
MCMSAEIFLIGDIDGSFFETFIPWQWMDIQSWNDHAFDVVETFKKR